MRTLAIALVLCLTATSPLTAWASPRCPLEGRDRFIHHVSAADDLDPARAVQCPGVLSATGR